MEIVLLSYRIVNIELLKHWIGFVVSKEIKRLRGVNSLKFLTSAAFRDALLCFITELIIKSTEIM